MGEPLAFTIQLESLTCGGCGTTFAVVSTLYRRYCEDGAHLRCPNPDCKWSSMHRIETEVAKLQKQLAEKEQRLAFEINSRRSVEASLANEVKAHGRLKKRVACGVCPCCQRSFTNLRRHMATKHPEVAPPPAPNAHKKPGRVPR